MIHKDNKNIPRKKITLDGGRTNQYGENRTIAGSMKGTKPGSKSRPHP
jgi:hypothetical protein